MWMKSLVAIVNFLHDTVMIVVISYLEIMQKILIARPTYQVCKLTLILTVNEHFPFKKKPHCVISHLVVQILLFSLKKIMLLLVPK